MTVSAVKRLMPSPPARVDSMKMPLGEPGRLNSSIMASRSLVEVLPSSRQYLDGPKAAGSATSVAAGASTGGTVAGRPVGPASLPGSVCA